MTQSDGKKEPLTTLIQLSQKLRAEAKATAAQWRSSWNAGPNTEIRIGLIIFICGIVLTIASGIVCCYATGDQTPQKALLEFFKFSMTTVLAGGAALFYSAYRTNKEIDEDNLRKRAEERIARRNKMETFFNEFVAAYNNIKYCRRQLRYCLAKTDAVIDVSLYEKIMQDLNLNQLKLEQFRRLLEIKPVYLDAVASEGQSKIGKAERYLRSVTHEYEQRKIVSNGVVNLANISKAQEFIHGDEAHESFFDPLDKFFKIISDEMSR